MRPDPALSIPVEHRRYGRLLHWGSSAGLLILVVTFILYVSGLLPSYVPLQRLPELWQLSASSYLAATASPHGWGWLPLVGHGEFASLFGIVFLAGFSVFCLAAVIPLYLARQDRIYAILCALEIVVLAVAASGILMKSS